MASTPAEPTPRTPPVELARAANHVDFEARRLEVRCGAKQLCGRTKRYVHVLRACVCRPDNCLLALARAASDTDELRAVSSWPAVAVR